MGKICKGREEFSYEEIYGIDTKRKTLDEYMESYSKYFKVSPVIKIKFDASSYRSSLKSSKELEKMLSVDN